MLYFWKIRCFLKIYISFSLTFHIVVVVNRVRPLIQYLSTGALAAFSAPATGVLPTGHGERRVYNHGSEK